MHVFGRFRDAARYWWNVALIDAMSIRSDTGHEWHRHTLLQTGERTDRPNCSSIPSMLLFSNSAAEMTKVINHEILILTKSCNLFSAV